MASEVLELPKAPNISKAFGYTNEKICSLMLAGNSSSLETMSSEDSLQALRKQMLHEDGILIDGDQRLVGMGSQGLVTRITSLKKEPPAEIPGAIARVEYMEPLMHDVVLRPAFKKEYSASLLGDPYKLYVVPNAPDIENKKITNDDIKRTIQVLKADGKAHHLWDIQPTAFVFLEDGQGGLISYPSSADIPEDFRSKPIAFVRDLNAMDATLPAGNELIDRWLSNTLNISYSDLPPAPQQCVDACRQQYALTQELAANLEAAGIKPNVDIPPGPWAEQFPSGTRSSRVRSAS